MKAAQTLVLKTSFEWRMHGGLIRLTDQILGTDLQRGFYEKLAPASIALNDVACCVTS